MLAAACIAAWRENGSTAAEHWLPYAILATLLLAVVLLSGAAARPGRAALAALGLLLALAVWTAVSATWSPVPTLGRDEALLTAFCAVALALPLVSLRSELGRRLATAGAVVAIGATAVATFVLLRGTVDPADVYLDGRLLFPISYSNAQAAFFLLAFWPAIAFAAARALPVVVRAGALGAATAVLAGWLLAQSKGGAIALGVSAIVFFAVAPARLRALLPVLAAGALVAVGARPLTDPFRASETHLAETVRDAGTTALLLVAAAFLIGLGYALVDRRVALSGRAVRAAGALAIVSLVVGAGAGAVTFGVAVDDPSAWAERQWRAFKRLPERETGATHLFSLGSNRYDFWRVALHEFADHPLGGVGARGFSTVYLLEGRSAETPQRAHSLELDVLSETGLVGVTLLFGSLALALGALARRARTGLLETALLAAAAYWVVHAGGDWIWTFPAVTVPAFVLIGIGLSADGPRPLGSVASVAFGCAAAAVALLVFAPPWLASRFVLRAYERPEGASSDLRWARRLDPVSTAALLAEAELSRGEPRIQALRRAVAKEPRRAELHYLLGVAYLDAGRKRAGVRELRAALRLYPRDRLTAEKLREAR